MGDKDRLPSIMWDKTTQEISHMSTAGRTTAVIALLMVLGLVYRLLAERQRRATLDHILTNAPGGSVILQEKSVAGPAMWVWVGEAPSSVAAYHVERVIVVVPTPDMSLLVERVRSATHDA